MTTGEKINTSDLMYKYQEIVDGFQVNFSASFSLIDRVSHETKKFLKSHSISKTTLGDVDLGIREALTNAIRHGTCGMGNPIIQYRFTCDAQGVVSVTVTDPGSGFDWFTVMHRILPRLAESGRGIFILQNCFDTVRFNKQGNEVLLLKMVDREKKTHG